jgi:hypothetical protein
VQRGVTVIVDDLLDVLPPLASLFDPELMGLSPFGSLLMVIVSFSLVTFPLPLESISLDG